MLLIHIIGLINAKVCKKSFISLLSVLCMCVFVFPYVLKIPPPKNAVLVGVSINERKEVVHISLFPCIALI